VTRTAHARPGDGAAAAFRLPQCGTPPDEIRRPCSGLVAAKPGKNIPRHGAPVSVRFYQRSTHWPKILKSRRQLASRGRAVYIRGRTSEQNKLMGPATRPTSITNSLER
jgi:hypothetical protein